MHPLRERQCDAILEDPALRTPPSIPPTPPPPKIRKKREYKIAPRFPLLDKNFYISWVNHQKELQTATCIVDAAPPELFPELYLKPRTLNQNALQLEENMKINKMLIRRINLIQRNGGYVDCWNKLDLSEYQNKLSCKKRQRDLDEVTKKNIYLHSRILTARSEQLRTNELNENWEHTKLKLILGAKLPFVLFTTPKIDRDIYDPSFDKPPNVYRPKVSITIWVEGGAKIGRVFIELFVDIVPNTCKLFMNLIRGDSNGYAYANTKIFRIVPHLYCRAGDVLKDNGFGNYSPNGEDDPIRPENFELNHSVPGVCSMAVTHDKEVYGHFNIIFKPLPQFDGKHVVFGRIVDGPPEVLERISALGLPLGTTAEDCVLRRCGWFPKTGPCRYGPKNVIQFQRKAQK